MSACLLATSALQIAARVVCQQARAIPRRVKKLMCLKNGQGPGLFNRHQRSSAGSAIAAPITMLTQRLHQARHQAALGIVDRQFEPFARTACAKAQRRQFT